MGTSATPRAFPGAIQGGLSKREFVAALLLSQLVGDWPPAYVEMIGHGLPAQGHESIKGVMQRTVGCAVAAADLLLATLRESEAAADALADGVVPWEEPRDDADPQSDVDLGGAAKGGGS